MGNIRPLYSSAAISLAALASSSACERGNCVPSAMLRFVIDEPKQLMSKQASSSHLRPVYAQHVISLDAEVKEKYLQLCEEEKARRQEVGIHKRQKKK